MYILLKDMLHITCHQQNLFYFLKNCNRSRRKCYIYIYGSVHEDCCKKEALPNENFLLTIISSNLK